MKRVYLILVFMFGIVALNGLAIRLIGKVPSGLSGKWQVALSEFYWVQAYDAWLRKDKQLLFDHYSFATALNPQNLSNWRLAAQTIAYDFPVWDSSVSREEYGQIALTFFEKSRPFFADNPEWFMTAGFLAETAMGNTILALQYLREAVAFPNHSFRTAQSYARLLIENGRFEAAHTFLVSWNEKLKEVPGDPHQAEIEQWIEDLEKQLNFPVTR
jgi:hypothetical protein